MRVNSQFLQVLERLVQFWQRMNTTRRCSSTTQCLMDYTMAPFISIAAHGFIPSLITLRRESSSPTRFYIFLISPYIFPFFWLIKGDLGPLKLKLKVPIPTRLFTTFPTGRIFFTNEILYALNISLHNSFYSCNRSNRLLSLRIIDQFQEHKQIKSSQA